MLIVQKLRFHWGLSSLQALLTSINFIIQIINLYLQMMWSVAELKQPCQYGIFLCWQSLTSQCAAQTTDKLQLSLLKEQHLHRVWLFLGLLYLPFTDPIKPSSGSETAFSKLVKNFHFRDYQNSHNHLSIQLQELQKRYNFGCPIAELSPSCLKL